MLFLMTYTIFRMDTYFVKSLKEHLENLSWIRAHLDNLEHRIDHYLPRVFDSQVHIEEGIGHSANLLEDISNILDNSKIKPIPRYRIEDTNPGD